MSQPSWPLHGDATSAAHIHEHGRSTLLLLGLAIACYVVAVICGGLGYSGRSSSNLPRLVFGVFLALTFIMIIVVGLVSPAHH